MANPGYTFRSKKAGKLTLYDLLLAYAKVIKRKMHHGN